MAKANAYTLENSHLRVDLDPADLAAHVTVKSTGERLTMAGAQPDDVLMMKNDLREWKSFAGHVGAIRTIGDATLEAKLPDLGLDVRVELEGSEVVFVVSPLVERAPQTGTPRDVLYPRHFLLPRRAEAYSTWPLGQGSIIPATDTGVFHHREGYAEPFACWLGGYTGKTGFCAIAETPWDLYQATDHRADSACNVFFHWLGSLGQLRYARKVRYHFAAKLDYVAQAKCFRAHCIKVGNFRTLEDKARENPNIRKLIGAPIVTSLTCMRRERTFSYENHSFGNQATRIEAFRKSSGFKNAVVHVDGWGLWGYDAMHPDILPPNAEAGGAKGLKDLSQRVKALGWLFGLHDQYIDIYQHAPAYDDKIFTVTEDGKPVKINRWAGGPCGHLCFTYIPHYIRRNYFEGVKKEYPINHNSQSIWDICAPTASYLDCLNRTKECWSKEHPLTRQESQRQQIESCRIVRDGKGGSSGQRVVLSVEHPRDFCVPYLDFAWSNGHFSADVTTTGGGSEYRSIGIPVPLWNLVFHDAMTLPVSGDDDLIEALLYASAPYFHNTEKVDFTAKEIARKKAVLKFHEDAAFLEMTGHELLNAEGTAQKCIYAGGLEVEVDKFKNTYKINSGRAKTKGTGKL